MPIKPDQAARYPPNWDEISLAVKDSAGWHCEGSPQYPACRAQHAEPHPVTGSIVVLTTAHLDHDPTNNARSNLRAWCQRCHLAYDAEVHRRNAAATRRAALNNRNLFPAEVLPFSPKESET